MTEFVEIEFKGFRRDFFLNPEQYPFKKGDYAIIQAEKGIDIGKVYHFHFTDKIIGEIKESLKIIIRKATNEDITKLQENGKNEEEALNVCRNLAISYKHEMKILDAEYQFDHNKLSFYFIAEERIDFREMVKDLAAKYKTRIELRQIGARDEARRAGGCGICGIAKCCNTFINEFSPVTTQLAKEQHLTLNPLKLSGVCGKLKCCLLFEKEFYQEAKGKFPAIETIIKTDKGEGKVEKIDIFNEAVFVRFGDESCDKMSLIDVLNILKRVEHT